MIKVTAESFIKNNALCEELLRVFPSAVFYDKSVALDTFCADAEALIVGREIIDEAFLLQCPKLKIISKYGVGMDNIDREACEKYNIKIGWTGGVNKTSVAELTLAFMLGAAHNVFYTGTELKKGNWFKNGGRLLSGKTIGILGVGHIGKELIRLLKPFQCKLLANDIIDHSNYYYSNNIINCSKEDLYSNADIITFHVPLTEMTCNMVGEKELGLCKPHSFLINTSRGEIIREEALKNAVLNNQIGGVFLDVFSTEPYTDSEFLTHPRTFCTPHIGGNAYEAVMAMGRSAISHVKSYYEKT